MAEETRQITITREEADLINLALELLVDSRVEQLKELLLHQKARWQTEEGRATVFSLRDRALYPEPRWDDLR
ncbi:hypothetical protein MITS9509_02730 [Synechococcus sp. MIT S9509]|uniref:hypothetical protein n=1 Tax=unclassified Synechococcus TaxID=2626047 RepID=UPI0007BBB6E2|nr:MULTISPECIES: hypothetical protein [unclassified Synechococcus]KZR85547.1 hypothetical protein MITS9504_02084 [Synechococcus sp. MIT S9504]KZR90441.1 hypothetical protein MITS9509_02730 [Synechococcus sp. MIT S9509]